MAIEITVPRLGWNMEEGIFQGWLKKDGEQVLAGEPLFCLETDKATQEVEGLDGGILKIRPDGPKEGDTVTVGALIAYLVQPGENPTFQLESIASSSSSEDGSRATVVSSGMPSGDVIRASLGEGDAGQRMSRGEADSPRSGGTHSSSAAITPAISPRAKRVAHELKIDWTEIKGSGRTGRIRERDVREAAGKLPLRAEIVSAETPPSIPSSAFEAIPITPTRQTIAQRLLTSVRSTVPVTITSSANATHLVNIRHQIKHAASSANTVTPTLTDFLVKLAAIALQDHPMLNARWGDEEILVSRDIHIGIAVDTEEGLLVPVIRDVSNLSLKQVAARSRDLVARARERKLVAAEMQGGTFTISNLGMYGIDAFTPIINYPECAVLGVGRIQQQPVFVGDRIVPVQLLTLSLTFDHRVVDGAPAARFLQTLCKLIENPLPLLI